MSAITCICYHVNEIGRLLIHLILLYRLRLKEEVDILRHLSHACGGRHPNVLSYVDSWEEGEALYILTELCESGNFARFLWEYGRSYPRLDEARVWKIVVDLSNVTFPRAF